jgi:hypothetical protein
MNASKIQSAICVIALLSGIHAAFAVLPPAIEWQRSYGGTNDDIPFTVERTPSGDFILAGFATIPDFWLFRKTLDDERGAMRAIGRMGRV